MSESIPLSRMDCYAGKIRAEVMPYDLYDMFPEDKDKDPYLYLQFVEGCGYSPYQLTPDEAEKLADMLREGA